MRRRRSGFTLTEVLVAAVLLGLVLVGLHRVHLQQRRVTDWQRQVARANDAFRVVSSVFSAQLREGVPSEGDIVLPRPDSADIRAAVGFALVCATRSSPAVIGLDHVAGRLPQADGDSLLVYATSGWRALAVEGEDRPGQRGMSCSHGPSDPEVQYRLAAHSADSVPVGATVRVFHHERYHVAMGEAGPWLARTDPRGTELLVGPLAPEGLRFRFLDELGAATDLPGEAVAVEVRVVLRSGLLARPPRPDTLLLVFQGRNR